MSENLRMSQMNSEIPSVFPVCKVQTEWLDYGWLGTVDVK